MESQPLSDDAPKTIDLSEFVFLLPTRGEWRPGGSGTSVISNGLVLSQVVEELVYGQGRTLFSPSPHPTTITPLLIEVVNAFNSSTREHKLLVIDDADYPIDLDSVSSELLSDQSSVEGIIVHCRGGMLSRVCRKIGHLLANSSTLEMLWFRCEDVRVDFRLSDAKVKALSEGLVQTKCIRTLCLVENFMKTQFADVLTSAFTGDVENTSLETIELPANMERLGMALDVLVSKYKNLKMIRLQFMIHPKFSRATNFQMVAEYDDNFQMVAECLRRWQQPVSDTSRVVVLSFSFDTSDTLRFPVEEESRLLSCWRKWLTVCANDGALKLQIRLELQNFCVRYPMWISEIVNRSSWLFLNPNTDIRAGPSDFNEEGFLLLVRSIQSTDTVEFIQLDLSEEYDLVPDSCWAQLFECLHHKRCLKTLVITCSGTLSIGDEGFRSLMDLVKANIYLEEVDLRGPVPEDWKVLLQEALRRNEESAAEC